jgi:hypothetical protein
MSNRFFWGIGSSGRGKDIREGKGDKYNGNILYSCMKIE